MSFAIRPTRRALLVVLVVLMAASCRRVSSRTDQGPDPDGKVKPWAELASGTTRNLNGVWAGGAAVIAVGDDGAIIASGDSGASWAAVNSGTTAHLRAAWGIGAAEVYVAGDGGTILRSTDGGKTLTKLDTGVTVNLHALWASDPANVFASGSSATILRSRDSGASWTELPNKASTTIRGLWGLDAQTIYAAAEAALHISTDGGDSWKSHIASATVQTDVWAASTTDVFITNRASVITRYDGSTFHKTTIYVPFRTHYAVWGAGPNEIYVVGKSGAVMRSVDGRDWSSETGHWPDLNDVFGAGGKVFAVGDSGTILVRNSGS